VNGNELALRPLRHFTDFRGRSTRGEMFYFSLLVAVFGIPALAVDLILPPHSSDWVILGITVLLLCPLLALCVRRLHDVGWSGWWIIFLLPAMALGAWNRVQQLLHPFVYPPPRLPLPLFVELLVGGLAIAVAILLLWDGDPETSRYGPNPRYGPVGEPA
jgi:uncharacterized membrane protein YhaH (DUF805 family)